ncbi:TonB-dependent siderophore receptor [Aliarcobacter butzleri]|uniref:TonB-dependent siderophore receptor n=1 Tax=Aliarcobacter butzleri TaxID=28197 RepID=UPI001919152B|nr:TonB-dependent siderophore receptor [Aliarcobacter butzleri]
MKRKSILVAPVLAILLNTSLNAEQFSISNLSLKQAIEEISKKSNMPYMVDGKLLDGKKAPNIKNIEGVENALNEILKDTNLKATIEDGTILIREKAIGQGTVLEPISVNDSYLGSTTENSNSYTTGSMNTATKLDLSIRETPQSVSVVTQQQIEDMGLENITDVVNSVTGLSSNNLDSERNSYSARGFGISNYQIDGVTTSYDSGYMSGETSQDLTIYDRVEVVRGATGLLTGAGDPSAAINMVRKHANSKEFKGNISLLGGSWDKYKGALDVQTPLDEKGNVRARIATSYEDKKSFIDLYENKKTVLYGVVDADITDNTRVSLGTSYQKNDPKGSMWGGLPSKFSDGTSTNWDRSKSIASDWTYWASENKNYFANVEHYFDNDIKLYGAYSYSDNSADSKLSFIYGNLDKVTGSGLSSSTSGYENFQKQHNVDIYTSIPFQVNKLDHEIVAGVMYSDQNLKSNYIPSIAGSFNSSIDNFYTYKGTTEPKWGKSSQVVDSNVKQTAGYLVGRISLTDDLKFIGGSRITNWERDAFNYGEKQNYEHNNILTPYAGLVYNIDDNYTIFTSYTDIFNPQSERNKSGKYLNPIEGKNYEAGIKAAYFEDKLNASFSVFRIEQDKLAQTDPSGAMIPGTTTQASIEAEGTTSKGFEIDINGEITDNWNLGVGYSQFEAKDADDNKINTSFPRKTFNVFSKYSWDKFSLGAGANWREKTYENGVEQESYVLVNAMAKYKIDKDLSVQLNVNNIFDEKYYTNVGFYNQVAYGDPRNFTLTMKYDF